MTPAGPKTVTLTLRGLKRRLSPEALAGNGRSGRPWDEDADFFFHAEEPLKVTLRLRTGAETPGGVLVLEREDLGGRALPDVRLSLKPGRKAHVVPGAGRAGRGRLRLALADGDRLEALKIDIRSALPAQAAPRLEGLFDAAFYER